MNRRLLTLCLGIGLILLMGVEFWRHAFPASEVFSEIRNQLYSIYESHQTQRLGVAILGFYFAFVLYLRARLEGISAKPECSQRGTGGFVQMNLPGALLIVLAVTATFTYLGDYQFAAKTTDFAVFIYGMFLGQGLAFLNLRYSGNADGVASLRERILNIFVCILAFASCLRPDMGTNYLYLGSARWTGPWENPNTFGLLMGVGIVLAAGLAWSEFKQAQTSHQSKAGRSSSPGLKKFRKPLLLLALALMSYGLLRSFSRGSWAGTLLGLLYLAHCRLKQGRSRPNWFNKARPYLWQLALIVLCLTMLVFWNFHQTEQKLLRRAMSFTNQNDFSWQNRLIAYKGALQMMAGKPFAGFGWGQPKEAYNNLYRPPELVEGMAIELNDYFTLAMTVGLPALACFVGYIYLRFQTMGEREEYESIGGHGAAKEVWLRAVCRSGVVVLLVGFWFERGLFFLVLATPFWILLELGAAAHIRCALNPIKWKKLKVAFPLVLAFLACMVWAAHEDPFQRINFHLARPGDQSFTGIAVFPKNIGPRPTIIYLQDSEEECLVSGTQLRQFAEQGFAAVTIKYHPADESTFERQFTELDNYLKKQPWAQHQATVWIGSGIGAQKLLAFELKNRNLQPQFLVLLSCGWSPSLEFYTNQPSTALPSRSGSVLKHPVLFVHPERDQLFTIEDSRRSLQKLQLMGASVTEFVVPDIGHSFGAEQTLVFRSIAETSWAAIASNQPPRTVSIKKNQPLWVYLIPSVATLFLLNLPVLLKLYTLLRTEARTVSWGMLARFSTYLLLGFTTLECFIHEIVPRLASTPATSSIADRFLSEHDSREDFKYLVSLSSLKSKPLSDLLNAAHLSSYNRQLINWRLEESVYRDYVLCPMINSLSSDELNWRRLLWANFYPRIRKENLPESAAVIVVRFLRERVTLDPRRKWEGGVETIWKRGITDAKGFEKIYVAALRSVGVGSRLDAQGRAEFWTGQEWKLAPRPLVETLLTGK